MDAADGGADAVADVVEGCKEGRILCSASSELRGFEMTVAYSEAGF